MPDKVFTTKSKYTFIFKEPQPLSNITDIKPSLFHPPIHIHQIELSKSIVSIYTHKSRHSRRFVAALAIFFPNSGQSAMQIPLPRALASNETSPIPRSAHTHSALCMHKHTHARSLAFIHFAFGSRIGGRNRPASWICKCGRRQRVVLKSSVLPINMRERAN